MSVVAAPSYRGGTDTTADNDGKRSMTFFGERLALLGAVTKVMGGLIMEEERERAAIRTSLREQLLMVLHFTPFDPRRVAVNAIEAEEHEERWELVHAEFDAHKSMYSAHRSAMYRLTASLREQQAKARAILEREATLRIVELVCHWEMDIDELRQAFTDDKGRWEELDERRSSIVYAECDSRGAIAGHEGLKWKVLLRLWNEELP